MNYTHNYTHPLRPDHYTGTTRTTRKLLSQGEMDYTDNYTHYTRPGLHVSGGFYKEPPERSQVVRPVNEGDSR